MSTSGFSSKEACHALIIVGLMSTSLTLTCMTTPPVQFWIFDFGLKNTQTDAWLSIENPKFLSAGHFREVFQPLLLGRVDDVLVVVELGIDAVVTAHAMAAVEAL